MTPEERELIEGVFERMRSVGAIDKDREAEALINTSVRQIRDSAYMLVQTVVVQGQALEQSELRMQDLEQQVADLEAQLQQQQQPQQRSSGGGFLGGIFGGGAKPAPSAREASPWGGSVPQAGRQSAGYGGPRQQSASPWNSGPPEPRAGGFNQQPMQQQPAAAGGGGFMRSALTTAAGVAGGVLVAGAIGMMRGDSGSHGEGGSTWSSGDGNASSSGYQDASSNDQGGTYSSEPQYQDAASNDQGTYSEAEDASYDDGGSDWGGDIET